MHSDTMFVVHQATFAIAAKSTSKDSKCSTCLLCGKNIKIDIIQSHVGRHILQAQMGVLETGLDENVS